jgi:hypothetical protein
MCTGPRELVPLTGPHFPFCVETGRLTERNLSLVLGWRRQVLRIWQSLMMLLPVDGAVLSVFVVDPRAQSQFKMDSPARKLIRWESEVPRMYETKSGNFSLWRRQKFHIAVLD